MDRGVIVFNGFGIVWGRRYAGCHLCLAGGDDGEGEEEGGEEVEECCGEGHYGYRLRAWKWIVREGCDRESGREEGRSWHGWLGSHSTGGSIAAVADVLQEVKRELLAVEKILTPVTCQIRYRSARNSIMSSGHDAWCSDPSFSIS